MKAFFLASAAALFTISASAGDWSIPPWTAEFMRYSLTVGGDAQGTLFAADMLSSPGFEQRWATGAADLSLRLQRDYDSGLSIALKSTLEVARDKLSYDNYGGDLVQKAYVSVQTGLGQVDVGMQDGVGYALAVTGPVVDSDTSLDNSNATFFLDPATRRAFIEVFGLNSAVEASLNYAKISYRTPRLFGVQLGVSFTPSEGKEVIPFLNNGPNLFNRQKSIWETAVSYSNTFGALSVGAYGAAAFGHADRKTAGHAGLTEWGLGAEIDYDVREDVKLALGGAYHHSNAYALDLYEVLADGGTESAHVSATLTSGPWVVGAEYGTGTADGAPLAPVIGVRGWQTSIGYAFNDNLQATVGWQELRYSRSVGTFYNGGSDIHMDAVFVHLKLHV